MIKEGYFSFYGDPSKFDEFGIDYYIKAKKNNERDEEETEE